MFRERLAQQCLWSGTLAGHDLWTRIRAAGLAGYGSLSVAPWELAVVLADDDERRLRQTLEARSLRLACLDPVVTWLPDPVPAHPAHRRHASVGADRCLELAERFGIGAINAVDVTWRRLPRAAGSHLATFAAHARQRDIGVVVEAQVYSGIPDLATAIDLCRQAGPGVQLLVDSWHYFRHPANRIADLHEHPVGALQLSDGPLRAGTDLVDESIGGRRMPGAGEFDLTSLVTAIAPGCLIGPEVFAAAVPLDRADEVAITALAATRRVLRATPRPGRAASSNRPLIRPS